MIPDAKFAERFAKIAELLRSPFDGERLAATARLNALMDGAGLTYTEFVMGLAQQPTARRPSRPASPATTEDRFYHVIVEAIFRHQDFDTLGERSREFVMGLRTRRGTRVSEKQRAWLDQLARGLGIRERAA